MVSRRQLTWVSRNTRRRDSVVPVRVMLAEVMASAMGNPEQSRAHQIAGLLSEHVDDQFASHCRVAGANGDSLTISVDQADLVFELRMRWLLELRDLLSRARCKVHPARINFRFGSDGVVIPRRERPPVHPGT